MAAPLLRFRSDEQLVALFRAGHEEAFRAIHDRYYKRLFAYTRQMLPRRQDAEDALQDVFVRAYATLRASHQQLALRAWLFRVAHNRCIDELRRPAPPPPEVLQLVRSTVHDPLTEVDLRESLRRLIEDIRRLPEQQRSALLMRELAGMSYADLSASLGISVGAVKSLLVRARVALAQAAQARDTSCLLIREQLVEAHDRGLRPNANARKHMRDCVGCKSFRRELRGMSRQLAAMSPAVGPLGLLAKTLGFSGSGGGAAGGGGLALLGGGGATASAGGLAVGINHVATLLMAAAATAGGAAAIQHTIAPAHRPAHVRTVAKSPHSAAVAHASTTGLQAIARAVEATVSTAPRLAAKVTASAPKTAAPSFQNDPFAGGPEHAPVTTAASLTGASRSKHSGPSSSTLQSGSSSPSSSDTCSAPTTGAGAASTATAAANSTSSVSTSTTAPAVVGSAVAPATKIPCLTPAAPSAASTPATTSTTSASTGSDTAGQATTSSGDSSSASGTSSTGSGSSAGSSSTSAGGGSSSK